MPGQAAPQHAGERCALEDAHGGGMAGSAHRSPEGETTRAERCWHR